MANTEFLWFQPNYLDIKTPLFKVPWLGPNTFTSEILHLDSTAVSFWRTETNGSVTMASHREDINNVLNDYKS
jgi:hypothetical protein